MIGLQIDVEHIHIVGRERPRDVGEGDGCAVGVKYRQHDDRDRAPAGDGIDRDPLDERVDGRAVLQLFVEQQLVAVSAAIAQVLQEARAEAGAILVAEMLAQQVGEIAQQLVALRKAELAVEVFHTAEIHVQQRHRFAFFDRRLTPCVREIEEVGHARQTGQIIVAAGVLDALLAQYRGERGADSGAAVVLLGSVFALVGVPYISEAGVVRGEDMAAQRMDDAVVLAVSFIETAVDHLVLPAFGSKAQGFVRDARLFVGVGIAVHIVIHPVYGVGFALKSEQLAEAVGHEYRHHAVVKELIDRHRDLKRLEGRFFSGIKPVFLHGNPPLSQHSYTL